MKKGVWVWVWEWIGPLHRDTSRRTAVLGCLFRSAMLTPNFPIFPAAHYPPLSIFDKNPVSRVFRREMGEIGTPSETGDSGPLHAWQRQPRHRHAHDP